MIKPKLCDVVKSRQLAPLTKSTTLGGTHTSVISYHGPTEDPTVAESTPTSAAQKQNKLS